MVDRGTSKQREKTKPNTQILRELAIYLTGLKRGKGDLLPLGEAHLTQLWEAIDFINKSEKL